jgi:hypothetical protein
MHVFENKVNVMSNMPHRDHDIKARTFLLILYCHWAILIRNYQPLKQMVKIKVITHKNPISETS